MTARPTPWPEGMKLKWNRRQQLIQRVHRIFSRMWPDDYLQNTVTWSKRSRLSREVISTKTSFPTKGKSISTVDWLQLFIILFIYYFQRKSRKTRWYCRKMMRSTTVIIRVCLISHSDAAMGRAERLLTSVSLSRCLWQRMSIIMNRLSSLSSRGPWQRMGFSNRCLGPRTSIWNGRNGEWIERLLTHLTRSMSLTEDEHHKQTEQSLIKLQPTQPLSKDGALENFVGLTRRW